MAEYRSIFWCSRRLFTSYREFAERQINYTRTNSVCCFHSGSTANPKILRQKQLEEHKDIAFHSLSPAVRYLISTHNLNPVNIKATGPKNRILKGDVLKYIEDIRENKTSSVPVKPIQETSTDQSYIDIPLSNMRHTIAKRLTESKRDIPYLYSVIECNINTLLKLRKYFINEKNMKITINDLLVKSIATTLELLPESNATWSQEDDTIKYLSDIDISVAVAIEGGLITPIIRNANKASVAMISSSIKELAEKARSGKLQPHEYQGGSFCISNLGMYGITEFTAIINPPQSAILAVGGVQTKPLLPDDDTHELGETTQTILATLSCDSRVINYELAGKWLQTFRKTVESPMLLGLS